MHTSLSTSHQIATAHDDWDRILLYRSWLLVSRELNVGDQMIIERRYCESVDGLWDITSSCLDWDIIVVVEVDTSLLLAWIVWNTVQLALNTGVRWARDVLAIDPSTLTGATWSVSTASSTGRPSTASSRGTT